MDRNNTVRDNAYAATCLRFDIAKALEQNKGTVEVTIAHLRAILDERDTFVRQVEDVIRRSGDDVAAAREERDALRARLEAAERVILLAQRADTYSSEPQENERGETFYYTFDPYMSDMANAMNEYLIKYDVGFGGRDE